MPPVIEDEIGGVALHAMARADLDRTPIRRTDDREEVEKDSVLVRLRRHRQAEFIEPPAPQLGRVHAPQLDESVLYAFDRSQPFASELDRHAQLSPQASNPCAHAVRPSSGGDFPFGGPAAVKRASGGSTAHAASAPHTSS